MTDPAPLAAVTGGTGFLGRYAVAALHAAGWRVRLLVRRDPAHPLLRDVPFEAVPGALEDADALARLVRGADAVVHVAGLTKAPGGSRAAFMAANRDGAGRLAAAVAREAPVARFVLVSSQAAREPGVSAYAASKRAGEGAAASALDGRLVILRPGVIYGPWDRDGLALLRLARGPLAPAPTKPDLRVSMIHARDAAAAIAAVLRAELPPDACFELSDAQVAGHSWRSVLHLIGRLCGTAARPVPVPDRVFLAAGAAADAWTAATRRPAIFGRGKARELLHRDWSSKADLQPPPELWTPRVGLEEGLAETVAWWTASRGRAARPG